MNNDNNIVCVSVVDEIKRGLTKSTRRYVKHQTTADWRELISLYYDDGIDAAVALAESWAAGQPQICQSCNGTGKSRHAHGCVTEIRKRCEQCNGFGEGGNG